MTGYIAPFLLRFRHFQPKRRYKNKYKFPSYFGGQSAQHTSLFAIRCLICSNTSEKRSNSNAQLS